MTIQYWVGDFFIDLSRNQITQNKQSQTIPPKALAVLTYLAKHQQKVVSQDELLAEIWPDTIVTPNTLQRSIAQLRKALGEDRKLKSYIKTHAKQGYSLECDVTWTNSTHLKGTVTPRELSTSSAPSTTPKVNEKTNNPDYRVKLRKNSRILVIATVGLLISGVIVFKLSLSGESPQLFFDRLQPITATDHKEFDAAYSPNGQYILFHRYLNKLCVNKLWARDIYTQEEFELTRSWGTYDGHSLSPDGKTLVFIAMEDCTKPLTQNICYDLVSLDFQKALEGPQQPETIMRCENSRIKKPVWLNNSNLAILQKLTNRWQLINYSTRDNKSQVLYDLEDGSLVDFDYSIRKGLIAITSKHQDGRLHLDLLDTNGKILSSNPIEYPNEIAENTEVYPNFSPLEDQLIFSTGRRLFSLSYNGNISKIDLPLDQAISSPTFHQSGQRAVAIKGRYDSDIASIPLHEPESTNTPAEVDVRKLYPSTTRSILGEDNGVFQPNGSLVAFSSRRSGEDQVWIADGQDLRQITQFPIDTNINGMDWAVDGQSLLINANKQLIQVFLDGRTNSFLLTHPVNWLFQWNSEENTALLSMNINGITIFSEADLNHLKFTTVNEKRVYWAQKDQGERLIYMDHMNRFWKPGPVEDQLIDKLLGQGSEKRFVVESNIIYGINRNNQLWSYNLDTDEFNLIRDMHKDVDYLTDINQENLLITYVVAAKKEVVELFLRK
ncbi:winged helix-turn-helix domain-containing protein [Microbulbifer sp. TYP-18]|uniref:winged helix-turn-helix domain-containing protein n=1 Tax=Microbulbifer sp. TYP-18 TaxID=3230024 RepID=UPI0034C5F18D